MAEKKRICQIRSYSNQNLKIVFGVLSSIDWYNSLYSKPIFRNGAKRCTSHIINYVCQNLTREDIIAQIICPTQNFSKLDT